MCGIAGVISINGEKIYNLEKRLKSMTSLLHHRGPDDVGYFISKKQNIGLSNNRLSIVSPKNKLELPFSKDNNEFLSFNGEIYNYLSLKKELIENGVNFSTLTDTEVLYEFLRQNNLKEFKKLNGMWAFAYYNINKNILLLSRDLLGERHLFYKIEDNELIFASEIEPILNASKKKNQIDFDSLTTSWKFNSCNPGTTLIKDIFKLNPGNNLILENGKITVEQFQKLHPENWFNYFNKKPSIDKVCEKFDKLFTKEVELRIPKDVNYLAALSGGIDSSILTYFLTKLKKNVKTLFGISENYEKKSDEEITDLEASYEVSKKLNTKHTHIKLNTPESINNINHFAENCFDGCVDPGVANFAGLAEYSKKKDFKVMLFSDGVDELLGGYELDIEANILDKIFSKNYFLREFLLKSNLGKKLLILFLKIKKNKELQLSYKPLYFKVNHEVCPDSFLQNILKDYDPKKNLEYGKISDLYKNIIQDLDYSQIRALNYASKTIPDMYNLRLDKAFMHHSVEVRLPFQSVELAEFFIAMPSELRFDKNKGKFILREFVKAHIDKSISNRPKVGMGNYLWATQNIYEILNFNKTISETNFFNQFPFKEDVKKTLIKKKTHPANLWAAYCYIKTFNKLCRINNLKN